MRHWQLSEHFPRVWTEPLVENGHDIWCMEYKEPYRSGSLTAARELASYKLDLVGEQEDGLDKEQGIIIFCMEKKMKIIWEGDFLYTTE